MTELHTPRSARKRSHSNNCNDSEAVFEIKKSRHSALPRTNDTSSLDVNKMSLRSGKNILKSLNASSCETSEPSATSRTPKRNTLTPNVSSLNKLNRRKSVAAKEIEEIVTASQCLEENVKSSKATPSQIKHNKRKSMGMPKEGPALALECLEDQVKTPKATPSQIINNRRKSFGVPNVDAALAVECLEEEVKTPKATPSQIQIKNNRKKSLGVPNEDAVVPSSGLEIEVQTPKRGNQVENRKSFGATNEKLFPSTISNLNDETPKKTPSQVKYHRRTNGLSNGESADEISKADIPTPSQLKNTRKSTSSTKEFSDNFSVPPEQDFAVSSTSISVNKEENSELPESSVIEIEESIVEELNTTFEVAEEDSILHSPVRKQSVRFATSVEVRRRTASFSASPNTTPFSTPEVYKKSSLHKGTPHPSSKKCPLSILKGSASKKSLSSSKSVSQKKNSAIKMPDFNSIHNAQFEKMESIEDFNKRRKCARKLTNHASVNVHGDKEASSTVSKISKTREDTTEIPLPSRKSSKPGTPHSSQRFHSEGFASSRFQILKERNFDARKSTPKLTLSNSKIKHESRTENNWKPHRVTYDQAKAMIQNRLPAAAVKRDSETVKNRNILKGVRLNRRFELQMQHRKLNMN